jgi:hypothetical protein
MYANQYTTLLSNLSLTDHALEHNKITFIIQTVLKHYDNGMLLLLLLCHFIYNSSTNLKHKILKMAKFQRLAYIVGPIT